MKYNVSEIAESYKIQYKFLDQFNNFQQYDLTLPKEQTLQMIFTFGIPTWLFDPYIDNEANIKTRSLEIKKGLFVLNENTIEVDKSAVINYYAPAFCRPIAEMIVSSLADYGLDNRQNRIEMAMRFVQDIPYGIPKYEDKKRHYGGVSPPPRLLIEGFGDCDSKVILFVGILVYLIPAEDIIFLNQNEHVLSAIKSEVNKGQTFITYNNSTYLIAETSGPGMRLLGEKGNYFKNKFSVETLNTSIDDIIPIKQGNPNAMTDNSIAAVDARELAISNKAQKSFSFQLSYDHVSWKQFKLEPLQTGRFNIEKQQEVYLRIDGNKSGITNYRLQPGIAYVVLYNNRKRSWEISF
ncbi:MAG: hypothetical protein R2750_03225 [Bacteroidales bacterium]